MTVEPASPFDNQDQSNQCASTFALFIGSIMIRHMCFLICDAGKYLLMKSKKRFYDLQRRPLSSGPKGD